MKIERNSLKIPLYIVYYMRIETNINDYIHNIMP